jgi:glutamate carboxypeptidase
MVAQRSVDLLTRLRSQLDDMVDALGALVRVESPSVDVAATAACGGALDDLVQARLGQRGERIEANGHVHWRWAFGGRPRVVLVGHLDTVWPRGTLDRIPFAVRAGIATGPGCFDMKAGIIQGVFALAALDDLDGVTLLVTSDEELGSLSSRSVIEDTARGAHAALVLEPSAGDGALKTERKGTSMYDIVITGRAAHAGLEPERGVNATVELAHQVLALSSVARDASGTTVTPTVASAGTVANVVPAEARVHVDVRATNATEQQRVDDEMRALAPHLPEAAVGITGGINRPPLARSSSSELFARAGQVAARLGLPELREVAVGGGSDGNFTAGIGVPTLDGLGAVGDGAHAESEHVVVDAMPDRAALVAALVDDLR